MAKRIPGLRRGVKLCLHGSIGIAALVTTMPTYAQAQGTPTITVLETRRQVQTNIRADGTSTFSEVEVITGGPFVDTVSDELSGEFSSFGTAQAQQDTLISSFTIRGSGEVSADALLGGNTEARISADASSDVFVRFTLAVDAPYAFTGTLDATGPVAGTIAGFAGFSPTGVFLHSTGYGPGDPPELRNFMFIGTAAANQEQNFSIDASVGPFGDREDGLTFGLGASAASFNFSLDFGDRDGDGLLDVWEEEGIDFDGMPPIDIDLPAMGSDPDVKDLFLELDVMEGVALDQAAIDQVIAAFGRAPAMDVDNNNNAAGINLHVLVDGDRPTNTGLVSTDATQLPPAYYGLKTTFFGSEADRNHPNAAAIRDVRLQIFRYCIWADTLTFELPSTPTPIEALGFAEGIPSNDFVIAAGDIAASYSDNVTGILAGTFMHEFGHTLGLAHGGQDGENFKPNYLSVMNYLYTAPISRITQQNTNVADYWVLDYSRKAMNSLNETALNENQGLAGPPGRMIYFNSAAASDVPPVRGGIALADLPYVNWNANNDQAEGPYEQDISRSDPDQPLMLDETLNSYSDWNRIWYPLAGTAAFDDQVLMPNAQPSTALIKTELNAIFESEWVDLVALDAVFSNSFEGVPGPLIR